VAHGKDHKGVGMADEIKSPEMQSQFFQMTMGQ